MMCHDAKIYNLSYFGMDGLHLIVIDLDLMLVL